MDLNLKGKRVLVTAAASGIGRATARGFAAEGAFVFICDVDETALKAFGNENPGIGRTTADVADEKSVDRLFAEALGFLGGLDILVNNAGISGPTGAVETLTLEQWQRTLDVNITGQFLCARRAVPELKKSGGGSIVNLSSVAGRFGYPLRTPYAASKWAAVGLTKSLSMELGPHNIRCNAILPGPVEGQRLRNVIGAKAQQMGLPYQEMEKKFLGMVSLGRMVSPEDVARQILFICSDAGRNISGQALAIDGDMQANL